MAESDRPKPPPGYTLSVHPSSQAPDAQTPPDDAPATTPPQRDFSGNVIPPGRGIPQQALDPTLGTEFVRGLAGDVYGAGQVAGHVLPGSITGPISASQLGRQLKGFATAPPTGGTAGSVARFAGAAAPFLLQPELGTGAVGDAAILGGIGGAVQPTESGSLPSHLGGAAVGAATGGLGGRFAGTPAQQAMRAADVRITPGRMLGGVGRTWENFASRLPVLNNLIGYGRRVSLEDFQHALYRDALEPLQRWIGGRVPTATGSEGLDQLRTIVTDRLNDVISKSTLPAANVAALKAETDAIEASSVGLMNRDTLGRLGDVLSKDIYEPIRMNGGMLPGSRLAGKAGVVATLQSKAASLWKGDPQDKLLADALDKVKTALLDHADIGAGGRPELDAARQSYARYITLSRAGSGATKEGFIDPDALLTRLRAENQDMFARGKMRMQPFALQARKAGVPKVVETDPEVGAAHLIAAGLFNPLRYASAIPTALYNRPMMSSLEAVADQARRLGIAGGVGAGQSGLGSLVGSKVLPEER